MFSTHKLSVDSEAGLFRRHHIDGSGINKVKGAAHKVNLNKQVSSYTLRYSFATHVLQNGTAIRTMRQQLGHNDVKITEIYTPAY